MSISLQWLTSSGRHDSLLSPAENMFIGVGSRFPPLELSEIDRVQRWLSKVYRIFPQKWRLTVQIGLESIQANFNTIPKPCTTSMLTFEYGHGPLAR